jgi:uncharacterized protein with HEPN domain
MLRIIGHSRQIVDRGERTFFEASNSVEFGAARMVVLDLDVAAEHLTDGFKATLPQIDWRALARTRDKYAHHYEDIDRAVVWNLLVRRLPAMAEPISARLGPTGAG